MCVSRSASDKALNDTYREAHTTKTNHHRNQPQHNATKTSTPPPHGASATSLRKTTHTTPTNLHLNDHEHSLHHTAMQDNRLRNREFALVYLAYMTMLMTRRNYGFWLPAVLSEMGKGKGEAGLLGTTFEMVYGTCALLNGVLIDAAPPKTLLCAALCLSAAANVALGGCETLAPMVALGGLNAFAQSFGWPTITNIFLAWFPDPAARGAWYSLLSTCQNAGAALVPLLVSALVASHGWRAALVTPAAAAVLVAGLLAAMLFGSPDDAEAYTHRDAATGRADELFGAAPKRRRSASASRATLRALSEGVLLNRQLWLMACSYFCISLVRSTLSDWSAVFLKEEKNLSMQAAARCLFCMETGGFAGSLAAGLLSDRLFAGRRGPVVGICSLLLAPGVIAILSLRHPVALQLSYAWVGCCAFPVHVLLGLFSREVTPARLSSSAGGFVKCIAQVGGAFAGYPLGQLQQVFGWEGVFVFLAAAGSASALSALPLWFTTAQVETLKCRHGTVADFSNLDHGPKSPELRGRDEAEKLFGKME